MEFCLIPFYKSLANSIKQSTQAKSGGIKEQRERTQVQVKRMEPKVSHKEPPKQSQEAYPKEKGMGNFDELITLMSKSICLEMKNGNEYILFLWYLVASTSADVCK